MLLKPFAISLFAISLATTSLAGVAKSAPEDWNSDDAITSSDVDVDSEDSAAVEDAELQQDSAVMAAAASKVTVPSNYVYNPSLGTLHDYCSYSPDSYLKADFRGPCARHDLCYGGPTDKKKCDVALLKNMKNNCAYAYGSLNPIRYTCYEVAATYFAAVVVDP